MNILIKYVKNIYLLDCLAAFAWLNIFSTCIFANQCPKIQMNSNYRQYIFQVDQNQFTGYIYKKFYRSDGSTKLCIVGNEIFDVLEIDSSDIVMKIMLSEDFEKEDFPYVEEIEKTEGDNFTFEYLELGIYQVNSIGRVDSIIDQGQTFFLAMLFHPGSLFKHSRNIYFNFEIAFSSYTGREKIRLNSFYEIYANSLIAWRFLKLGQVDCFLNGGVGLVYERISQNLLIGPRSINQLVSQIRTGFSIMWHLNTGLILSGHLGYRLNPDTELIDNRILAGLSLGYKI